MAHVDPQKRREIMRRSMTIGACICDPRRQCPCDVFTEHGLCPCAGERPDPNEDAAPVGLMAMVHNAGCASKIPAGDLQDLLAGLPLGDDPAVIAGAAAGDDAGLYALTDEVTLVQTVDVFTPCVDDPRSFGRICAANCLSDIYAMGGVPRTALSILCFPIETAPGRIMREMMLGALDVLTEAGVALIGGHSVKDEEIKLGFAITGCVPRDRALRRDVLNEGDLLVLTKPLGVGALNFAAQIGRAEAEAIAEAENWMTLLNRRAAEAAVACEAAGCTDITGFGLFGHLAGMLRSAGREATIYADRLPAMRGAREALAAEIIPGAVERNREFVGGDIKIAGDADAISVLLGFDGQTSGGLLIAIAPDRVEHLLERLEFAAVVGRVGPKGEGRILVRRSKDEMELPAAAEPSHRASSCCCESKPQADHGDCCADVFKAKGAEPAGKTTCCCPGEDPDDDESSTAAESLKHFGALMRSAAAAGTVDQRTKELITFALVILQRCEDCVISHVKKARAMGLSDAQLDEAAWCAVAIGGAPVKVFWDKARRLLGQEA